MYKHIHYKIEKTKQNIHIHEKRTSKLIKELQFFYYAFFIVIGKAMSPQKMFIKIRAAYWKHP